MSFISSRMIQSVRICTREHRRERDVEREPFGDERAAAGARFLAALRGEVDVGPAGEKVLLVPVALSVADEHELAGRRPVCFCHAVHFIHAAAEPHRGLVASRIAAAALTLDGPVPGDAETPSLGLGGAHPCAPTPPGQVHRDVERGYAVPSSRAAGAIARGAVKPGGRLL